MKNSPGRAAVKGWLNGHFKLNQARKARRKGRPGVITGRLPFANQGSLC